MCLVRSAGKLSNYSRSAFQAEGAKQFVNRWQSSNQRASEKLAPCASFARLSKPRSEAVCKPVAIVRPTCLRETCPVCFARSAWKAEQLFVAQGFDGIHLRGADGWVESEDDTDQQ